MACKESCVGGWVRARARVCLSVCCLEERLRYYKTAEPGSWMSPVRAHTSLAGLIYLREKVSVKVSEGQEKQTQKPLRAPFAAESIDLG